MIWIEARGGARVVTGEAHEPADLAGRAERLLAICRALSEGLVDSNEGRPERVRQAVDEILATSAELPSSDDEMLAGWLRMADDALQAGRGPEHSLVKSLANRRREAAARLEIVLRKLR